MKKTLTKLLAIFLSVCLLFTTPVVTALAEENDCPIEEISLTLHRPIYENIDGYWDYSEIVGDYFYYNIYDYVINATTINIYYKDGTSESLDYYEISERADLRCDIGFYGASQYEAPWHTGMEIEAYFDLCYLPCDETVFYDFVTTVEETPIESIEAEATKSLVENVSGNSIYDEDAQQEFYQYDVAYTEPTFTVKWKDPSKSDSVIAYNDIKSILYFEPEFSTNQSYENQWVLGGSYSATASLLGVECDFEVSIISSAVKSISVEATYDAIIDVDSNFSYDYENEAAFWEYNFDAFWPEITLTFENGFTLTEEYGCLDAKTNYSYNFWHSSNQSSKTPWSKTGNYSFTFEFDSNPDDSENEILSCIVPVTIVENPIEKITAVASAPVNANNYYEQEGEEGSYKYYYENGSPLITVYYTDGTVSKPMQWYEINALFGEKYWCSIYSEQGYGNEWQMGKNKCTVDYLGHSADYDIYLTDKVVKSIKVLSAKTNSENGYYGENDNFIYNTDFDIELELTLWDDSVVTKTVTEDSCNEYGFVEIISDQETTPWSIGGENVFTVKFTDYYEQEILATGNVEITEYFEFDYYFYMDMGVVISGYYGTIRGTMEIPDTIDGKPVFSISSLYSHNSTGDLVTGVVIPDSVTQISNYALSSLPNITSLSLGSGLTVIPEELILGCSKLESLSVSEANPNYYSSQNAIYTKDKTKLIAVAPACTETILLPSECTDISVLFDHKAEYGNVKIGYETAGDYCTTVDGVTYTTDKTTVISCDKDKSGDIVLPDTVKDIAPNAFLGCDKITSVTIPNTVTNIAYAAFGDCTALKSVTLPTTLQSIGDFAFGYCTSLTEVNFPSELTSIGEAAFMGSGLKNVTVPDKVEEIGRNAFRESKVETAKIGKAVKSMPKAFYECVNLKSVNVPASMELYDSAFYGCTSLSSANLENGLGIISTYAFLDCSALTSVTIPNSVTDIEEKAFAWSGLKSITIPDSVVYMGEGVFSGCSELTTANISNELEEIGKF
ncbi:MAG: leucine-rich repeat domain-containing protein, partial [Ruminococcaceae bacterium]|nr:leucine-rich repeat domain-containing protein [Oscillospiraceae bacterium]